MNKQRTLYMIGIQLLLHFKTIEYSVNVEQFLKHNENGPEQPD